jgi:hypothetical protein
VAKIRKGIMAIFKVNNKLILFIHVPKCAGSSVTSMLEMHAEKRFDARTKIGRQYVRPRHMASKELEKIYFSEMFDYSFMTVRNPIHRVISEYRYQCRKTAPRWQSLLGFDQWLSYSLLRHTINPYYRENHFRKQNDFRAFNCDVFRIEDGLIKFAKKIKEVTGGAINEVPQHLNKTEEEKIYMKRKSLVKILITYKEDFSAFDYPDEEKYYKHLIG